MRTYRRMSHEDRLQIKAYLDVGLSKKSIASKLNFAPSTISREILRNQGGRGYRPKQATRFAAQRQQKKHFPRKMTPDVVDHVSKLLVEKQWSPEQIAGRLKLDGVANISHETVYQMVFKNRSSGGDLYLNLRFARKSRKPRFPRSSRKGTIIDAMPISERPRQADKRKKRGHWERDTLIGARRSSGLLVVVDRKTRFTKIKKLERRTAKKVTLMTARALKGFPLRSITNDRGQEFADHKSLSRKLRVPVYFCNPYSSYERGTNENTIGLVRQYIPKKTCLDNVTAHMIQKIENNLNHRPRKCLDWKTPYEAMFKSKLR